MEKIGILTFHYALNHGSVLQAQATQIAIEKLGYECEIIDYRFISDEAYDKLYFRRGSKRTKICRKLMFFLHKKERQQRIRKFQEYTKKNLKLSNQIYRTYSQLMDAEAEYSIFLSGSDQIWSSNVPEIMKTDTGLINGYFLAFTSKPKVAYASCVATMTEGKLSKYTDCINAYNYMSTREKRGANLLKKITGRDVPIVLDPSFLLTGEEWGEFAGTQRLIEEKYILLYSLRSGKAQKCWLDAIKKFNNDKHLKIVVVAPYFYSMMRNVINMLVSGPGDFLNLVKNAEVVFTDSFHGTAFAVNFNKPLYSLGTKYWKNDPRKTYLLETLGMTDRLINDETDIVNIRDYSFDYGKVNECIDRMRDDSIAFLRDSLSQLAGRDFVY